MVLNVIIHILSTFLLFKQDVPVNVVIYGDSITAGYGIDMNDAFPAETERILRNKGYNVNITNAGSSGETSAGGVTRINWILKKPVDIFVLELGGNDGLRGLPLSETKKNLQLILDRVKEKYPNAKFVVAGMEVPPNLGKEYTSEFRNLYPNLAKNNQAVLIPFLLENVGGYQDLNLSDGIHPNEKGHKIVAQRLSRVLAEML